MKNVYTTEEIQAVDRETALAAVEDMIEKDNIDEFSTEHEDWQIDSIEEV